MQSFDFLATPSPTFGWGDGAARKSKIQQTSELTGVPFQRVAHGLFALRARKYWGEEGETFWERFL
jgi:hypothetical protein